MSYTPNILYTDEYKEICFTTWYSMRQPTNMDRLRDAIPETIDGRKPTSVFLRKWRDECGWNERADALNALAVQKVEEQLINQKADMLRRQAAQAYEIAQKAREHLLENGFDTSASAVNALFKATEEERIVRGVSDMMVRISKMSPEELMKEAAKLLKRNSEVIDGVVEEEDADESIPTAED